MVSTINAMLKMMPLTLVGMMTQNFLRRCSGSCLLRAAAIELLIKLKVRYTRIVFCLSFWSAFGSDS